MTGETAYIADFATLMSLDGQDGTNFRSLHNDRNDNGRVYGGQLLAQVVGAALRTVPADRPPTVLQALFLSGAKPEVPLDYTVTPLQDGRRFSSRQVTARQGTATIISAHVSFQVTTVAPGHATPMDETAGTPEAARPLTEVAEPLTARLGPTGYLGLVRHPYIESRFVDPLGDLVPNGPGRPVRFWMRIAQPLPDDPGLHACGLAYLSDWWLSYASVAPHLDKATYEGFYVASLNHSLWFHAPCRATDWLYVIVDSPWAGGSRGLSAARLYRQDGVLAASMVQEALQTIQSGG